MRKSKIFSRFILLLFLGGLTIALGLEYFQFLPVAAEQRIFPRVEKSAIASKSAEVREIEDAEVKRKHAQYYNRRGRFSIAIALLCGERERNGEERELLACTEDSAIAIAQEIGDGLGEIDAWGILAETYRLDRDYQSAVRVLEKAEQVYQTVCPIQTPSCAFSENKLLDIAGQTYSDRSQYYERLAQSAENRSATEAKKNFLKCAQTDRQSALEQFAQSEKIAASREDPSRQIVALLEILHLYRLSPDSAEIPLQEGRCIFNARSDDKSEAHNSINSITESVMPQEEAIATIETLYAQLVPSRQKAKMALYLAAFENALPVDACPSRLLGNERSRQLLVEAIEITQQFENPRLQSFALGELGKIEECEENLSQALYYTNRARLMAQSFPESLYLWEWQAGRIYEKIERRVEERQSYELAIEQAYELAIETVERLIPRIYQYSRDWQFNFRDRIAPLYHRYVRLRLDNLPAEGEKRQKILALVGKKMEALQLVELTEYLGQDYNPSQSREDSTRKLLKEHTAIFRSIFFEDKTAIILERRDRPTVFKWVDCPSPVLKDEIQKFLTELKAWDKLKRPYLPPAQKLYQCLIAPFDERLQESAIETLVFIQDGILNKIPMAALHDGREFLVQRYAIATTPGLTLTQPKAGNFRNFRILAFGLTKPSRVGSLGFPALTHIKAELCAIKNTFTNTQMFLDKEFSPEQLRQELDRGSYSILHLATHAQFGTVSDDTFLVTGAKIDSENPENSENQTLTLLRLEKMLQQLNERGKLPHLLVLSACETATGDDRFALGLGGISLRAGIPATVASLWSVYDDKTKNLMAQFYKNLRSDEGVAVALQEAQIEEIAKDTHPFHWAQFITIGNWL